MTTFSKEILKSALIELAQSDRVFLAALSADLMSEAGPGIAETLGIGLGTIGNCKHKYQSDGLYSYLDKHYVPYLGKLTDAQLARLDEEVSQNLYATIGEVVLYIHRAFGIAYCERAVCAILQKLDFVCKKTNNVPCKADPVEQEAFLGEMVPFLAEIEPDEAVYFLDGVHPQHNTRATYAWIKRGEQKNIPANSGRQRVNISGAMNAHRPEEVIIHESERINAQATIALCEKILLKSPGKRAIYLFCDNATYYRNADMQAWLQKNTTITLIHLPTYSPNLNLIERLWKFMRKKVINLKFYPKFKQFRAAIFRFFEDIGQYKEELHSLMRHNFQRFAVQPQT